MQATAFLKSETSSARRPLRLAAIGIAAGGFLLVAGAWIFTRLVDSLVFPSGAPADRVWPLAALLAGIYAARSCLGVFAERQALTGAQRIKENLRARMAVHMFRVSPLHAEQAGALANHLVEGLEALQTYYAGYLPARINAVFVPFVVLAALVPADWLSALVMLLTLPLVPVFMILVGRGAERLNQRQWKRLAFMSSYFLDLLQGLTTLKLFNASRGEAAYLARVGADYTRDTMAVLRVAFLSSLVLEFFATVSIAAVAVTVGFRLLWQHIDFINGFYVLLLAPELYLPLRRLGVHYHARMEATAAAGHIHDFLQIPELPQGSGGAVPQGQLSIRFDHVSFTYPDSRVGLDDVSFELPAGGLTLLAGTSGSGKTTILLLLLKFIVPNAGRIWINGVDLQDIDRQAWWRKIGWVPQKPRLFSGTVGENIGSDPALVDAMVRRLSVDWLPDIVPMPVGEAARYLSGGQVQIVALARALARDPSLLLLDEPTANLDHDNAGIVNATVQGGAMTRLVATHHLADARLASQVILLERGRVAAAGTHEDMLRQSDDYRRRCNKAGEAVA